MSIYMTTRSHTCVTLSCIRSFCTLSLHYPELLILHNMWKWNLKCLIHSLSCSINIYLVSKFDWISGFNAEQLQRCSALIRHARRPGFSCVCCKMQWKLMYNFFIKMLFDFCLVILVCAFLNFIGELYPSLCIIPTGRVTCDRLLCCPR